MPVGIVGPVSRGTYPPMKLRLLGKYEISLTKAAPLSPLSRAGSGGWYPWIVREPFMGAWQQNQEIRGDTALSYFAVFSCVTLIAADVAKLHLRLVEVDDNGIWRETTNPAYSPVLRKPNRYQTIVKFIEQWITSKLVHGNTYVLKERDARGVVRALYVLDPTRVVPLVARDGSVYYELRRDDLSGIARNGEPVTVPASEIIHDMMIPLFHPLIGVSPLYACGISALHGLSMQSQSNTFFQQGARPSGILTAPGAISDETAKRLADYFNANFTGANAGKVAAVGDDLKYQPLTYNAVDTELIKQLNWTAETICSCYHVPAFKVGVGPHPPYSNVEPMNQQYYSDCIQSLLRSCETVLDEGLGLDGTSYGTEFDIDDLIWLDTSTRTKAAAEAIGSGAVAPNEARRKWFGLGPVAGGDTPYMQVQNYALSALAARDNNGPPSSGPPPAPAPPPELPAADVDETDEGGGTKEIAALTWALLRKDWSGLANAL
jgi:HK97 family phage portal protein